MLHESRGVVDGVHGQYGDGHGAGHITVVREVTAGRRVGGEPLDPGVQGRVVVRPAVTHPLVAEGAAQAEPSHDVAEREGREGEVRLQGPLGDLRDREDVVQVPLLEGCPLRRLRGVPRALLEPGPQSGARHGRIVTEAHPQGVRRLRRARMVPAVVLVDDTQVHPVVVTTRAAREDTVGEQRAVIGEPGPAPYVSMVFAATFPPQDWPWISVVSGARTSW